LILIQFSKSTFRKYLLFYIIHIKPHLILSYINQRLSNNLAIFFQYEIRCTSDPVKSDFLNYSLTNCSTIGYNTIMKSINSNIQNLERLQLPPSSGWESVQSRVWDHVEPLTQIQPPQLSSAWESVQSRVWDHVKPLDTK